jgi:hypothetical protein
MLTIARLSQLAYQLADEAHVRADYYKEQLRLLQARQTEIQTSLGAANLSRKRFAKFKAQVNGHLQCPRCWIDKAMRSPRVVDQHGFDLLEAGGAGVLRGDLRPHPWNVGAGLSIGSIAGPFWINYPRTALTRPWRRRDRR